MTAAHIVGEFAVAFIAGELDGMQQLLADDCIDANPAPVQPPGRHGILLKAALFHAQFRGFATTLADIEDRGSDVIATWTTRFPTGELTRWRGTFVVANDRIARFEVAHVA